MSTRGAYGFLVDGQKKVAYNHGDSYPDYLGINIKNWLKVKTLEQIRKIASGIVLVNSKIPPTPEQVQHCQSMEAVDTGVGRQSTGDWYCLLRNTQGDLSFYERGLKFMSDSKAFLSDPLWCEWAYVFNCDTGELNVYSGAKFVRKFTLDELKSISDEDFVDILDHPDDEVKIT